MSKKCYDSSLEEIVGWMFPTWKYHPGTIEWISATNQRRIAKASPELREGMRACCTHKYTPDFQTPKGTYIEVKGLLDEWSRCRWVANPHVVHILSFSKEPALNMVDGTELFDTEFRTRLVEWYRIKRKPAPCVRQGMWLPITYKTQEYLERYGCDL